MRSLNAALGIFASPRNSFAVVRERAPWRVLLVLVSLSSMALYRLSAPFLVAAFEASLPADAGPDQLFQAGQVFHLMNLVRFVLAPFIVVLKWLLGASLLWLLATAFGVRAPFRRTFSLVAHVSLIPHLYEWVGLLTLRLKGIEAIRTATDVRPPLGLDRLLRVDSAALTSLLTSINPFSLWQLALLALGASFVFVPVRAPAGARPNKPWPSVFAAIAASYWVALIGLQALVAGAGSAMGT